MELRPPPRLETQRPAHAGAGRGASLWLGLVSLALLAAILGVLLGQGRGRADTTDVALEREVAAKLRAAGALDEAADLYAAALHDTSQPATERARLAYGLGQAYLEAGRYERALRWLYEAESLGAGPFQGAVSQRIVECLERLGRHHAAQAALASGSRLPAGTADAPSAAAAADTGGPVVAEIAGAPIHRAEVLAMLDELPPEAVREVSQQARLGELLRRYVADELLYRKAQKLSLDDDPEVRRQLARLGKQVVLAKLVEREVMTKVTIDPSDLANFFAAHRDRYQKAGQQDQPPSLEQVRGQVEHDYRMSKAQAIYAELVASELGADGVKLYPERMQDAPPAH